jgi:coenzyme Q-binding protein COQ10
LDAKIYEKKEERKLILIIADLTIGKGPFKATYKSDVRFNKDTDTIQVTNIEGPLKHLDNKWVFIEKDNFTEVAFDIDFEIENKFLNILMTKSFQYGLDKIADSFQRRANDLFKAK